MDDIFVGPDASNCDGDINMYSNLMHILTNEFGEKLENPPSIKELFENVIEQDFEPNFEVNYSVQHKFRVKSISTLYYKEAMFAALICFVNYLIYYNYVYTFREEDVYWTITGVGNKKINGLFDVNTVKTCNDQDICIPNGMYDFGQYKPRTPDEMEQYFDKDLRDTTLKNKYDEWVSNYRMIQYLISIVLILPFTFR